MVTQAELNNFHRKERLRVFNELRDKSTEFYYRGELIMVVQFDPNHDKLEVSYNGQKFTQVSAAFKVIDEVLAGAKGAVAEIVDEALAGT